MYEVPHGSPVVVRADHQFNGSIIPIKFKEEDSETQVITRIVDCRLISSLKYGSGEGLRYTVFVKERCYQLFYIDNFWYVSKYPAL